MLTAGSIILIFNNHAWNNGIWSTPTGATDPLVCMINYVRVACTFTLSPLTVTMDVNPATINFGQKNILTLDTEYLIPYNGIKHPNQGGQYILYMKFYAPNNTLIQQQSFYHTVLPNPLRNFYVNSTVNDVGVENMFFVEFELGSATVNAFNDATTYSRIFI